MSSHSPNTPTILSIPQYVSSKPANSSHADLNTSAMSDDDQPLDLGSGSALDLSTGSVGGATVDSGGGGQPHGGNNDGDGIGEYDDGRSGKLTLSILLAEGLIEAGDGVMTIDYLGQSFKGDLLPVGKIRSLETGLIFNNPSAWAIYCKKIINPAKKSGCGWASVKYKGRKMDYYKSIWLKRKAQREAAENAKNEAAQALTALSNSGLGTISEPSTPVYDPSPSPLITAGQHVSVTPPLISSGQHTSISSPSTFLHANLNQTQSADNERSLLGYPQHLNSHSNKPIIKHSQMSQSLSNAKENYVELDSFVLEGKIQPFTVSVSTSAILIVDLHSHLCEEDVCGYLAGHWDPISHNLAITHTFPCLIDKNNLGTEEARRVESEIYSELYRSNLSLVGWYHSSPKGPSLPSVKDCLDQLDFQIKLLGYGIDSSYTPCVGLICSPYDTEAKSVESSVVVYWIHPPAENNAQDCGRPMRMSYSAVTDPYLSEDIVNQIDKTVTFYSGRTTAVPFLKPYTDNLTYIDKIGKSLVSKFPQDQDEGLWDYIRSGVLEDDDTPPNHGHESSKLVNGNKASHDCEEEIDDDEDSALKDEQEIDDDEENAIAACSELSKSEVSCSPLSFNQVISTSPARLGNNGELDLSKPGEGSNTITMYSHQEGEHPDVPPAPVISLPSGLTITPASSLTITPSPVFSSSNNIMSSTSSLSITPASLSITPAVAPPSTPLIALPSALRPPMGVSQTPIIVASSLAPSATGFVAVSLASVTSAAASSTLSSHTVNMGGNAAVIQPMLTAIPAAASMLGVASSTKASSGPPTGIMAVAGLSTGGGVIELGRGGIAAGAALPTTITSTAPAGGTGIVVLPATPDKKAMVSPLVGAAGSSFQIPIGHPLLVPAGAAGLHDTTVLSPGAGVTALLPSQPGTAVLSGATALTSSPANVLGPMSSQGVSISLKNSDKQVALTSSSSPLNIPRVVTMLSPAGSSSTVSHPALSMLPLSLSLTSVGGVTVATSPSTGVATSAAPSIAQPATVLLPVASDKPISSVTAGIPVRTGLSLADVGRNSTQQQPTVLVVQPSGGAFVSSVGGPPPSSNTITHAPASESSGFRK